MNVLQNNGVFLNSKTRRNMVELAGGLFQRLGLPRSTGQIYGFLYLSRAPMSLDDIVESLGLSKGSASNGTRYLASLGAIRQVWVPGERRDYFESIGDLNSVMRKIYSEFIRPRIGAGGRSLSKLLEDVDEDRSKGRLDRSDAEFCRERVEGLLKVQKQIEHLVPLAEKLIL